MSKTVERLSNVFGQNVVEGSSGLLFKMEPGEYLDAELMSCRNVGEITQYFWRQVIPDGTGRWIWTNECIDEDCRLPAYEYNNFPVPLGIKVRLIKGNDDFLYFQYDGPEPDENTQVCTGCGWYYGDPTTTTTTACPGSCAWVWDQVGQQWLISAAAPFCPEPCACVPPLVCGKEDCEVFFSYCSLQSYDMVNCSGTTSSTTTAAPEDCPVLGPCTWRWGPVIDNCIGYQKWNGFYYDGVFGWGIVDANGCNALTIGTPHETPKVGECWCQPPPENYVRKGIGFWEVDCVTTQTPCQVWTTPPPSCFGCGVVWFFWDPDCQKWFQSFACQLNNGACTDQPPPPPVPDDTSKCYIQISACPGSEMGNCTTGQPGTCEQGLCKFRWNAMSSVWSLSWTNCPTNCTCLQPPAPGTVDCEIQVTSCYSPSTTTSTSSTTTGTTTLGPCANGCDWQWNSPWAQFLPVASACNPTCPLCNPPPDTVIPNGNEHRLTDCFDCPAGAASWKITPSEITLLTNNCVGAAIPISPEWWNLTYSAQANVWTCCQATTTTTSTTTCPPWTTPAPGPGCGYCLWYSDGYYWSSAGAWCSMGCWCLPPVGNPADHTGCNISMPCWVPTSTTTSTTTTTTGGPCSGCTYVWNPNPTNPGDGSWALFVKNCTDPTCLQCNMPWHKGPQSLGYSEQTPCFNCDHGFFDAFYDGPFTGYTSVQGFCDPGYDFGMIPPPPLPASWPRGWRRFCCVPKTSTTFPPPSTTTPNPSTTTSTSSTPPPTTPPPTTPPPTTTTGGPTTTTTAGPTTTTTTAGPTTTTTTTTTAPPCITSLCKYYSDNCGPWHKVGPCSCYDGCVEVPPVDGGSGCGPGRVWYNGCQPA